MELILESPVRFVPHVGPVMAGRLANLEIFTVQDLLYHVPFRYNDFTLVSKIARVQPGETVTITATIETFRTFITKTGKKVQEAVVSDETGRLHVIWFNQVYLLKVLHPGDHVHFSGKIDWFGARIVMSNPAYEITTSLHTGRLVPVYPETAGVTSKWLRGRIAYLLETISPNDFLPQSTRETHHLMGLTEALRAVHFPENKQKIEEGRHRIAFDEVFLLQLTSCEQKRVWQETRHAKRLTGDVTPLLSLLPFELTADQKTSVNEICTDLAKTVPMNRLLVGDVGSGKTVVAASAMYIANCSSMRSVLMAPTQILAEQHYKTISEILRPFHIRVGLVTSYKKEAADVLVGTHALLTNAPANVGLVVIDEQHRFGVQQRSRLIGTGKRTPHVLTMTATPIPRTIAKTMLGSTDLSILTQMPKGRQKIKTWVVPPQKRLAAYDWIKKQQGQVFVICPLIEASESLTDVKAVKEEFEKIKTVFWGTGVGLLHGKLKASEKTRVIDDFRTKKTMILVATPVVEVGIDIPGATIMIIEGAERFGLGQLHQLRGRVGRSDVQSYCLLFTESTDETALLRLKSLETIHNGPELSEVDLRLRGPGEVFGTRQHGMPHFKIASFTDMETIKEAERAIRELPPDLLRELGKKHIMEQVNKD